jgi:hypothetical protein
VSAVWKPQPVEVLQKWIATIKQHGRGLTDWEKYFVGEIEKQLSRSGRLSERQHQILEKLYADKTPT